MRDPLIDTLAGILSDLAKLVIVMGLIPLGFVLAGPVLKAMGGW